MSRVSRDQVSTRVTDVLAVLDEIVKENPASWPEEIVAARINALKRVAKRKYPEVTPNTVQDSCQRRLGLRSIEHFDTLVRQWLLEGTYTIRDILEHNAIAEAREIDLEAIRTFFAKVDAREGWDATSAAQTARSVYADLPRRNPAELIALAQQQGVGPLDYKELEQSDFWPADEDTDELLTTLRAWRHEGSAEPPA